MGDKIDILNFDDETLQEVLNPGTDLRKYSRQVEKELKEIEDKSINDYIKESENIASLHNQICACDDILAVGYLYPYSYYCYINEDKGPLTDNYPWSGYIVRSVWFCLPKFR